MEDSALLDPAVAARVAHNAYLLADRKGMKEYDIDIMGSNMVSTMIKVKSFISLPFRSIILCHPS